MRTLFDIIYEDNELLVVNKPAGLVCHPTKGDEYSSLISRVRLYLTSSLSAACGGEGRGEVALSTFNSSASAPGSGATAPKRSEGGQPSTVLSPHLVNRLDRETSGVTIIAKNAVVAGELGRLWESRSVEKEYLAIVHGHVREEHGLIDVPLGKDERSVVAVKDCVRPDGAPSRTDFWVVRRFNRFPPRQLEFAEEGRGREAEQKTGEQFSLSARVAGGEGRGEVGASLLSTLNAQPSTSPFTLLRIVPRTGRKHQIRIHLAHIGHPIVGDKLYGGDEDLYMALVQNRLTDEQRWRLILPNQALHARTVRFIWRGKQTKFCAEPESRFAEFLTADEQGLI